MRAPGKSWFRSLGTWILSVTFSSLLPRHLALKYCPWGKKLGIPLPTLLFPYLAEALAQHNGGFLVPTPCQRCDILTSKAKRPEASVHR